VTVVAVFGATGQTGRRVVERLVRGGVDVVAFGRRPHVFEASGVRTVVADLTRSSVADLEALLGGVDAVVFAAAGDPVRVDRDGALRAIEAAERAGVGRFVLITGMGVGRDRPRALTGGFWDAYFGAKEASERGLRASTLRWTILQPGELLNRPGADRVDIAAVGSLPIGAVSRDDVAAVVAAVLDRDDTDGRTWELVGGSASVEEAIDEALRR